MDARKNAEMHLFTFFRKSGQNGAESGANF
jgi:hypothetical protein